MEITVCYNRPSYFGGYEMARDTTQFGNVDRLKKAFRSLKKDRDFTIHIDDKFSVFWETSTDYENQIITVRSNFTGWNSYDQKKAAYDVARKEIIKHYEA